MLVMLNSETDVDGRLSVDSMQTEILHIE